MVDETITEAQIWADIDAQMLLLERQPGDIDCRQIMARYDIGESAALRMMRNLSRSGDWEMVTVRDDESGNGRRRVIRKVRR